MKKLILGLAAAALLAGCSVSPDALDPNVYDHAGVSKATFRRDYDDCVFYAQSLPHKEAQEVAPTGYSAVTQVSGNRAVTTVQPDIGSQLQNNANQLAADAYNLELEQRARAACMRAKGYKVTEPH